MFSLSSFRPARPRTTGGSASSSQLVRVRYRSRLRGRRAGVGMVSGSCRVSSWAVVTAAAHALELACLLPQPAAQPLGRSKPCPSRTAQPHPSPARWLPCCRPLTAAGCTRWADRAPWCPTGCRSSSAPAKHEGKQENQMPPQGAALAAALQQHPGGTLHSAAPAAGSARQPPPPCLERSELADYRGRPLLETVILKLQPAQACQLRPAFGRGSRWCRCRQSRAATAAWHTSAACCASSIHPSVRQTPLCGRCSRSSAQSPESAQRAGCPRAPLAGCAPGCVTAAGEAGEVGGRSGARFPLNMILQGIPALQLAAAAASQQSARWPSSRGGPGPSPQLLERGEPAQGGRQPLQP